MKKRGIKSFVNFVELRFRKYFRRNSDWVFNFRIQREGAFNYYTCDKYPHIQLCLSEITKILNTLHKNNYESPEQIKVTLRPKWGNKRGNLPILVLRVDSCLTSLGCGAVSLSCFKGLTSVMPNVYDALPKRCSVDIKPLFIDDSGKTQIGFREEYNS